MVCSRGQHPPPHQAIDHGPFSQRRHSLYWSFGQFPLSCVCPPSLPPASWLCPWAAVRVFERLFSLPIPGQLVGSVTSVTVSITPVTASVLVPPYPRQLREFQLTYENPWSPVPYRLPTLYSYSASRTVVRRRGLSAALNCFGGGVRVPSNPSLQRRWSVVVWRGNVSRHSRAAIIHRVTRLRNSSILKCMQRMATKYYDRPTVMASNG